MTQKMKHTHNRQKNEIYSNCAKSLIIVHKSNNTQQGKKDFAMERFLLNGMFPIMLISLKKTPLKLNKLIICNTTNTTFT